MNYGRIIGLYALLIGVTSGCEEQFEPRIAGESCQVSNQCESSLCHAETCLIPAADDDLDGLINDLEAELGTDPFNADTDGDGRSDALELGGNFYDPPDDDGDGKPNVLEGALGSQDADLDCLPDQLDPNDSEVEGSVYKLGELGCCCGGDTEDGGMRQWRPEK